MAPVRGPPLERFLPATCPACARDLLTQLFRFDPSKRMPCAKVCSSQCVRRYLVVQWDYLVGQGN